jgi:hypothetical protein
MRDSSIGTPDFASLHPGYEHPKKSYPRSRIRTYLVVSLIGEGRF